MKQREKNKRNRYRILFLLFVFFVYLAWACTQRFNFSPDEKMRYQIAQYIYEHGTLPHGGDPEIRNADWGISYAFNPILSYIISAVFMKITSLFTQSEWELVIAARMANVLFGTASAFLIFRIGEKRFKKQERVLFCFLCTMLPGAAILFTYVNTDGLALFSSACIIYMWVRALEEGWTVKNCILLGISLSLCVLSYYNAYGYGVCSILFFAVSALGYGKKKPDWKRLFLGGFLVTAVVAVLAGWWFVRNSMIYDGDFLARRTMHEYAIKYAKPEFNPNNVTTFQEYPDANILTMLLYKQEWMPYRWTSYVILGVVGVLGYNQIFLSKMIYFPYLLMLGTGLAAVIWKGRDLFYLRRNKVSIEKKWNDQETIQEVVIRQKGISPNGLFHVTMLIALVIPNILNLYYSYTSDYQPQGRYSMPMLIPLMYFVTVGCSRLADRFIKNEKLKKYCFYIVAAAVAAIAVYVWGRILLPLYLQNVSGLLS